MTVYVHRGYLCLKDRLYRHRCQMILLTFARFIENSTVSKLCRNYLIKTVNERNNSKFDQRTTNFKDKRCIEDRRTAIFRGEGLFLADARRLILTMSDELLVMSPLVPHAQRSFVQFCDNEPVENSKSDRPTTNFKDERYVEDRRTARCRDELFLCTFFRKRYPKLLASKFLCKSLRLLSLCHPKFWRPAFSKRTVFPSTIGYLREFRWLEMVGRLLSFDRSTTNFKDEWYVEGRRTASEEWRDIDKFRPNAEKFGPNALAEWRNAFTDMPNAVSGGRNASTERRNAFNSKRNAGEKRWEVKKRWRGALFFWQDVKKLGRNAIALKLPALSFLLSNFLFCVCLAHARRRGLGTPAATGVALKIVPLLQIKRRNASKKRWEVQKRRRGASFFWRDAKKLGRNAITSKLSALSFSLSMILFCVCLAHAGQRGVGNPAAACVAFQNGYAVTGKVLSATTNEPLDGATISILGKQTKVLTNADGVFRILASDSSGVLLISFVGYQSTEINFNRREAGPFTVQLESNGTQLEEVQVSTGYQTLPKERATGSFVQVDNELFNRSVSTDVISRLKGVTPSLAFDERAGAEPKLSIRGRSTIFANDQPLIVLDNFPYEGDINSINPNDIESISILRDAAAASIWGVRAGNGVIVITTKKGQQNKPVSIAFNANVTVGDKPNLFYEPKMHTSDYIDVEQFLFGKGYYDNDLNDDRNFPTISPVVGMLAQHRAGTISSAELENSLAYYRSLDVRDDLLRYFYQQTLNQQYALSFQGGGAKQNYFVSIGYDKNRGRMVGMANDRFTSNVRQVFNLMEDLTVGYNLTYSQTNSNQQGSISANSISAYPYNAIYDRNGQEQPLIRDFGLSFAQSASERGLLDWQYFPLQELTAYDSQNKLNNIRFAPNIAYQLTKGLTVEARYQYERQLTSVRNLASERAYSTRNEINQFTELTADGSLYHVPLGAMLNFNSSDMFAHNGRAQLNYGYKTRMHTISAVGGMEVRQIEMQGRTNKYLGYDVYSGTSKLVNYDELFRRYPSGSRARISNNERISGTLDRFRSYYVNGLYEFQQRISVSASARIDQTNLFGVKTNQRSVPLWSSGLKWNISNESFYRISWLPFFNTRFTYGYNGNFDKNVTAFLTASYTRDLISGERAALLGGVPNPRLRAEKTAMYNYAVEFGTRANRIRGKIEYYKKKGTDLIGSSPIDPTTGKTSFRGNVADMKGAGWDIELNTINTQGAVKWSTNLILNQVSDRVTSYEMAPAPISAYFNDASLLGQAYITPMVGRPLFGIYSYPWAGLNEKGDPQGYLNGRPSTAYTSITNAYTIDSLVFHGRALPAVTGAIRNTFSYRALSLSFNILFKTGYYFRRPSINYTNLFSSGFGHADFEKRWQNPGDEFHTDVPSMVYPAISAREIFYANTETLVEKGDHIRLQDIRLDYDLGAFFSKRSAVKSCRIYLYANNIGILWRANKQGLDPDFAVSRLVQTGSIVFPTPRTVAIGVNLNL
jgi:TonB-dependent starch-binding outer membrane protein SusC